MKITIEFTSSYEAKINIDGREMVYSYTARSGGWSFISGLNPDESETTIGGIIACKLTSPLIDILQGWLPEEQNADDCCWETWEKLTDSAASEVLEAIE